MTEMQEQRYPIGRFAAPPAFSAETRRQFFAELAACPGELRRATAGLSAAQLDTPYREHGWNHSLSDVISALLGAGLQLNQLVEYDYSPFDIFPNLVRKAAAVGNEAATASQTPDLEDGFWFRDYPGMLPLTLSLAASRRI